VLLILDKNLDDKYTHFVRLPARGAREFVHNCIRMAVQAEKMEEKNVYLMATEDDGKNMTERRARRWQIIAPFSRRFFHFYQKPLGQFDTHKLATEKVNYLMLEQEDYNVAATTFADAMECPSFLLHLPTLGHPLIPSVIRKCYCDFVRDGKFCEKALSNELAKIGLSLENDEHKALFIRKLLDADLSVLGNKFDNLRLQEQFVTYLYRMIEELLKSPPESFKKSLPELIEKTIFSSLLYALPSLTGQFFSRICELIAPHIHLLSEEVCYKLGRIFKTWDEEKDLCSEVVLTQEKQSLLLKECIEKIAPICSLRSAVIGFKLLFLGYEYKSGFPKIHVVQMIDDLLILVKQKRIVLKDLRDVLKTLDMLERYVGLENMLKGHNNGNHEPISKEVLDESITTAYCEIYLAIKDKEIEISGDLGEIDKETKLPIILKKILDKFLDKRPHVREKFFSLFE
jgi:hypothetical protein